MKGVELLPGRFWRRKISRQVTVRCVTERRLAGLLCSLPLVKSRVLVLKEVLHGGLNGDVVNEKLACSLANDRVLPQGIQKHVEEVRKRQLEAVKHRI
jgi:hypothetical protein